MTDSAQLRLEQVSLRLAIAPQYLLQDISVEAFPGDRIALVGPSGSGKTTLLRLLNRLSEPSSGKIYFEGEEITQIPVLQLRQQVTLVLQESKLLGMTVRDALSYPLLLRNLPKSTIQQRLLTWTEQLQIPQDWLERTEVQLSVGQRQLVAIARALMIQPKILLLDEPTSALDAGRGTFLMETLKTLAAEQQTTLLMANHQLDRARQFCDRLLYLQQGRLLQDSPASQIDWDELQQRLVQAEQQTSEEWA